MGRGSEVWQQFAAKKWGGHGRPGRPYAAAPADKVHKQEVPCTQWYALHTMATLYNNHSYISSGKFNANCVPLLLM